MFISKRILIKGLVQGVGFRPSIYRLALKHNLTGTVENNNKGVIIVISGSGNDIDNFINCLPDKTPQASNITSIVIDNIDSLTFNDFTIVKSSSQTNEVTEVSPDISVCKECLYDLENQPARIDYPFSNCTNCGPRFTIIKDLPYDRPKTTMDVFPMCEQCLSEYSNILDRRFHAQPVACNNCGPHYTLHKSKSSITNINKITDEISQKIEDGEIIAIKGLGGYHLACDATNETTIKRLRNAKSRDGKPFALMFKDIESAKKFLFINNSEEKLLTGWRKPIVLLNIKKEISKSISIGLNTVGVMLPYMPLHFMLFNKLKTPAIVLTSGNISDEPIIISNKTAIDKLGKIADLLVTYNRDIYNRTDDSVAKVINDVPRVFRRSRGYAPSPINTDLNCEGIFACGAELVNCFAIGKGNQVILSQHIGDLKNLETLEFYSESVNRFFNLFRFTPSLAAIDMHPDYLSTQFAEKLNIPTTKIQHHHAHIASCMAEHNIDEQVIGISFDGTGLGDDGNIWGGEFMICDLIDYKRINHFEYIKQPGGDAVTKHPWRMMTSYLMHYFGNDFITDNHWLFDNINSDELETVISMIDKNINCPLTSSAGRLFDAISALLNLCKNSSYHAEAPMVLESNANIRTNDMYGYDITNIISFKSTFAEIIHDLKNNISIADISGKFHNTIIDIVLKIAINTRNKTGINKVVMSGGSFQNSILLEKVEELLKRNNFQYFTQATVPSNDGGIALGQLAIAAKRREQKLTEQN